MIKFEYLFEDGKHKLIKINGDNKEIYIMNHLSNLGLGLTCHLIPNNASENFNPFSIEGVEMTKYVDLEELNFDEIITNKELEKIKNDLEIKKFK